ncbi:helix-turn-helix domain-containing protein [Streptomyces sp. N2A]|uniref:helix-turn-helix domain-containing protein n=1 Tax=Streptomyces sp. N2A TaxID=3073936 RepID=UPI00287040A7|nr:helix-turn-helix domain-containing protein [Streptomyces sp. N2A]
MFSRPETAADVVAVLELLAQEAPPSAFDALVHDARAAGAPPEDLARLSRARDLGLRVQALFQHREQREAGLNALVETARDLTLPYTLHALLKVITRRARLLLHVDMSYISFPAETDGDPGGDFYVHTADGQTTALTEGMPVPGASGLTSDVQGGSAPFWTPDYLSDERIAHSEVIDGVVRAEGLRAVLAVPLRHADSFLGVLYCADRKVRHFTPDEIALMTSLADLAAVAIEKSRTLNTVQAEIAELELAVSAAKSGLAEALRGQDAQARLTGLLLEGGDLHALAQLAGEELEAAVLVVGPDGATLAPAGERPGPEPEVLARAALDAHHHHRPAHLPDGTWVAPVAAGAEDLGTLVVRPSGSDGIDQRLLAQTARTAAVMQLMLRSTTIAEGQIRDAFFDDLLTVPHGQTEQLQERARRLSIDLDRPHVVVVARPEGGAQGRALIWASSYTYRTGGLRSIRDGVISLLLPGEDAGAAAKAVSDALTPLLDHPVTVGAAGPFTGLEPVRPAFQEAMRCLDALAALDCHGTTASARDLGFLGVLLGDVRDVSGFIEDAIGPVLAYDAQRFTQLVPTLEAYFDAGGSPTYAAEALHVHPNTVSRRLERITELLGPDWQKPAQTLEIQLALRLQRVRGALRPYDAGPAAPPPAHRPLP